MAVRRRSRNSVGGSRRERKLLFERLEDRTLLAITTFTPVADTHIVSSGSFGSATVLDALDLAGNSLGDRIVYIRFDLSGVDLSNFETATLTLSKVAGSRNDTIVSDRFDVYGLTNAAGLTSQTWSEATLNASNVGTEYTSTGGNGLNTSLLFNLNQESGANVTEIVNNATVPQRLTGPDLLAFLSQRIDDNGLVTFITEVDANHTDSRGWGYGSRENATTLRPTLELDDGEPVEPPPNPYPENPIVLPRQMERLDRGIVAVRDSATSVYVGWRLLGNDPANIAFNLYRSANGGAAVKLNGAVLTQTTDFVDTTANLAVVNEYHVRPVINGIEQTPSESFTLAANAPTEQYLSVLLQKPADGTATLPPGTVAPPSGSLSYSYIANDSSVGDLDGDGEYEIVLKWDPSNSQDNSLEGLTGPVILDAYKLDGTRLWRINLGRNIRAGAHYTQFLVYDFDGDGRAEVVMKTADGTIDGMGNVIGNPNADYRDGYTGAGDSRWGRILSGPEFLTVFDGLTGAALSTIPFSPPRGSVNSWGSNENYGNRVDRFLATVAYLDGTRPSIVMARGYYAKTRLTAYDWRNGQLTQRWDFDSTTPGNGIYGGQGNHNLSVADVDGDGKDEIVYGAMVLDDNGQGLYSTGLGHGDAMHVSDMDPTNPGLEVWQIHEASGVPGADYRDAQTGEAIFTTSINSGEGPGRGVAADVWAGSPGYEMWTNSVLRDRNGNNIGDAPDSVNFLVWWDADPLRELFDGQDDGDGEPRIDKYAPSGDTRLLTLTGTGTSNSTKANPSLIADIYGDWREEVIVRASNNLSLRIYTTTIPSTTRLFTLMHDSQYREAIAWQNVAYNQPAHPSFFLGAGMATPLQPTIFFGGELTGDYNADSSVDAADYVVWRKLQGSNNLAADGDHNGTVGPGDHTAWQNNFGEAASPGGGAGQIAASQESETTPFVSVASHDVFAFDVAQLETSLSKRRITTSVTTRPSVASHRVTDLLLCLNFKPLNDDDGHSVVRREPDMRTGSTAAPTLLEDLDAAFAALECRLSNNGSF